MSTKKNNTSIKKRKVIKKTLIFTKKINRSSKTLDLKKK